MKFLVLLLIVACSPESKVDEGFMLSRHDVSYDFDDASEYTYPSNFVEVSSSTIGLKPLDFTMNSGAEYLNGTATFTSYATSQMTLDSVTADSQTLASDWTPQWGNIVGYWKLDNDALDSSGNGNNGSIQGDTFFTTDRKIGSHSAYFDDNSDRIIVATVGNLDFGTDFSMSLWVKKLSAPVGTQDFIFGGHECPVGCAGQSLALNPTTCFTSFFDSPGTFVTGTRSICDGLWHHIAVTYESGALKVFVDGQIDIDAAISASLAASADDKSIGGFSTGGLQCLEGWLDDFMLWDTQLTDDEVALIYEKQKQKYAGIFVSEVYNLGTTSGLWASLGWNTQVPYSKEVAVIDSANESTSEYPGVEDLFSTGLLGNYQMDDLTDETGANPNGVIVGNTFFSSQKKLGTASAFLDGVGDRIDVTGPTAMNFTSTDFSISAWFRSVSDLGNNQPLVYMGGNPVGFFSMSLLTATGFPIVSTRDTTSNLIGNCTGTNNYVDGKWHQMTVVRDSTNDLLYLYIDGEEENSCVDTRVGNFNLDSNMYFGWQFGVTFHGNLDDFVFLNKAITPSQVRELYRRGANDVLHQVRSCATDPCTSETWTGPDGTSNTWFRESENCTSIDGSGVCNGATEGVAPVMLFSEFVTPPANNQYFQYRTLLTSSDEADSCDNDGDNTFAEPCLPQVRSISVNPSRESYIAVSSFVTDVKTEYKEIQSITSDATSCASYQVSQDKSTFYYHDGSSWVVAADDSTQSNTLVELNAFIESFNTDLGTKGLYFRVYLSSDTATPCSIDAIDLDVFLR